MKTPLCLTLLITSTLTAFAGHAIDNGGDSSMRGGLGSGPYLALQIGSNVGQQFDVSDVDGVSADFGSNAGLFAGLKFGWVLGGGAVRPAVELDAFYNGFETDVAISGRTRDVNFRGNGSADTQSVAALMNFILRLNANGRFQPYIGAGLGLYYASTDGGVEVNVRGREVRADATQDSVGFAWQLIGGADFYLSDLLSVFAEYKFLNYEGGLGSTDGDIEYSDDAVRQHLIGAGLRVHF